MDKNKKYEPLPTKYKFRIKPWRDERKNHLPTHPTHKKATPKGGFFISDYVLSCYSHTLYRNTTRGLYSDKVQTCTLFAEIIYKCVAIDLTLIDLLPMQIVDADMFNVFCLDYYKVIGWVGIHFYFQT